MAPRINKMAPIQTWHQKFIKWHQKLITWHQFKTWPQKLIECHKKLKNGTNSNLAPKINKIAPKN